MKDKKGKMYYDDNEQTDLPDYRETPLETRSPVVVSNLQQEPRRQINKTHEPQLWLAFAALSGMVFAVTIAATFLVVSVFRKIRGPEPTPAAMRDSLISGAVAPPEFLSDIVAAGSPVLL